MNDTSKGNTDARDVASVLLRTRAQPSAAHDEAVMAAAERLLDGAAPRDRRWRRPVALVATVLLALTIALPLAWQTRAPDAGDAASSTVRSVATTTAPAVGARLSALPDELRWPGASGTERYRVVLRDAEARRLWTSAPVSEPRLSLPAAAKEALDGQATCHWSVQVIGAGRGTELGPFWFYLESG